MWPKGVPCHTCPSPMPGPPTLPHLSPPAAPRGSHLEHSGSSHPLPAPTTPHFTTKGEGSSQDGFGSDELGRYPRSPGVSDREEGQVCGPPRPARTEPGPSRASPTTWCVGPPPPIGCRPAGGGTPCSPERRGRGQPPLRPPLQAPLRSWAVGAKNAGRGGRRQV